MHLVAAFIENDIIEMKEEKKSVRMIMKVINGILHLLGNMDVDESNTIFNAKLLLESSIELNKSKEMKMLKHLKILLPTSRISEIKLKKGYQ